MINGLVISHIFFGLHGHDAGMIVSEYKHHVNPFNKQKRGLAIKQISN